MEIGIQFGSPLYIYIYIAKPDQSLACIDLTLAEFKKKMSKKNKKGKKVKLAKKPAASKKVKKAKKPESDWEEDDLTPATAPAPDDANKDPSIEEADETEEVRDLDHLEELLGGDTQLLEELLGVP